MNSPFTGLPMKLVESIQLIAYKGEEFEVPYQNYYCEGTDEYFTDDELDTINLQKVHNAYCEKHNKPLTDYKPGDALKAELSAKGISQKDFAKEIDMQPSMLSEVINGKRAITIDIALRLEKALDKPGIYWAKLQAAYELDLARVSEAERMESKATKELKEIDAYIPISDFMKLDWFKGAKSLMVKKLLEIFGAKSAEEFKEQKGHFFKSAAFSHYRKSEKLTSNEDSVFAWSKLAIWQAAQMRVGSFDPSKQEALIQEIKSILLQNESVLKRIEETMSGYGIKFLVLGRFKQSPIDGYSFWSDGNPAIVLTMNKKTLDSLAFTLMHELGHVFLHIAPNHEESFIDCEDVEQEQDTGLNQKELEANDFARNTFIPKPDWDSFMVVNHTFEYEYNKTEKRMQLLAEMKGIHPSIVLGRFKFETGVYNIRCKTIDCSIG